VNDGTSTPYLLGLDLGTYSSKGVLVNVAGEVVASRSVEHALETPHPGWAEHDAEACWWRDFLEITQSLFARSGVSPRQVVGVGFSAIAPAVLPIDRQGQPLHKAILYGIDTRASAQVNELQEIVDHDPALRASGIRLSSQSAAPKVLWLRRHVPQAWARTYRVVNGSGFLLYRLTGEAALDVYDAATFAPFFDLPSCRWTTAFAEHVAPLDKLPRVTWTCDVAGRVSAEGARRSGLAEGTPIVTGTADAAAEAISTGLANIGDLMVMYGSSVFFILRTSRILVTPSFWTAPFLEKGTYVLTGGMSTSGSLTRWFRDQFALPELEAERAGGANAYSALAGLAASSPLGANGLVVLPYFSGERTPILDPHARGMVFGLSLRHTRADVYRALLESVGFGIRHNIEVMRQQGADPKRILAVGGGSRNALWMQIVSDIANIEQFIPAQQIGASYGDAFLAGVGVALFSGTADVRRWVKTGQVVKPNPNAHRRYEDYYRLYRELYTRTAPLMRQVSGLQSGG